MPDGQSGFWHVTRSLNSLADAAPGVGPCALPGFRCQKPAHEITAAAATLVVIMTALRDSEFGPALRDTGGEE